MPFLRSDAPAAAVQEMERLMRLHDDVMRVLTIKVDAHARALRSRCRNVTSANRAAAHRKES